jgi:hypothetical protein
LRDQLWVSGYLDDVGTLCCAHCATVAEEPAGIIERRRIRELLGEVE